MPIKNILATIQISYNIRYYTENFRITCYAQKIGSTR